MKSGMTPQENEGFPKTSPADKLRRMAAIQGPAREWMRSAFKAQRPDGPSEQIDRPVQEVFRYGVG